MTYFKKKKRRSAANKTIQKQKNGHLLFTVYTFFYYYYFLFRIKSSVEKTLQQFSIFLVFRSSLLKKHIHPENTPARASSLPDFQKIAISLMDNTTWANAVLPFFSAGRLILFFFHRVCTVVL